jgi:RHS repeat-associated protein
MMLAAKGFTGKERDAETGLDYFGERYYSSSQGRFTTPDPLPGWPQDPQSWNMYAYGRNNPLKYVDPDGTTYRVCDADGKNCRDITDAEFADYRKHSANLSFVGGSKGAIYAKNQDGSKTYIGSFKQTEVDLDPMVAMALHSAGVAADREVKQFMKDTATTALAGVVFTPATAAVSRLASAGPEVQPLLRAVDFTMSRGNVKHMSKHLAEFQKISPGMTFEGMVNLGVEVVHTGRQVAGKAFAKTVEIGGREVTVRAVLDGANKLRSVHILQ